jgi:exodeoxyribonuclease V alpha subunit
MTSEITTQLRVTSVRSRGACGGAIFAGKDEAGKSYVVKARYDVMPDPSMVDVAQVWRVAGAVEVVSYLVDGLEKSEVQILPTTLELQRPSGSNLVAWIAHSRDCKGIGAVRARRLYERFGLELVSLIESGDVTQLSEIIDVEAAESLIAAFALHDIAQTLVWLEQIGLPKAIAASASNYWGKDGRSKIEENPYVLLSFCASWKTVDALARSRFGIPLTDRRRLIGVAEEVLHQGMKNGDTAMSRAQAIERINAHLGDPQLSETALAYAVSDGRAIMDGELFQAAGLAYIENYVADALTTLLTGAAEEQNELFVAELPSKLVVQKSLKLYESMHQMELTPEQRAAVVTSATSRVSLILGGAGTGKTTVLKALCNVLDCFDPGAQIHQLALAGRAAQRMTESTGRPSSTIAAFLLSPQVAPGSTVLVDEMSMVDVILMYRVLKHLPPGVRLVMIGDPAQLPPIGPGLVLHALDGLDLIPQTKLKTVKRQSAVSGIPHVATAVREYWIPEWAEYAGRGSGVSVVACSADELDEAVAQVYEELGGSAADNSVQILGTTKNGYGGVKGLNAMIHSRFAAKADAIQVSHPEFETVNWRTDDGLSLYVSDLVIFGANDYLLGLRNGSMGKIIRSVRDSTSPSVCAVDFDGTLYDLTAAHLQHLSHAYCITTHRAQGSQFDRIIIPIRRNRLLDNALLYTAITRGVQQVVVVGDLRAAEEAICAASKASKRVTRLGRILATVSKKYSLHQNVKIPILSAECP